MSTRILYGTELPRTDYEQMHARPRSIIGELTKSMTGNVVLRIGRETGPEGPWFLTEHVVLSRDEAQALSDELRELIA